MIAILYRMVGGFIGLGPNMTGWTRLRWAVPMGLLMAFAALTHQRGAIDTAFIAVLCAIAAYLGRLIPHAIAQADGKVTSMLYMSAVGTLRLALILLPYAVTNWADVISLAIPQLDLWVMSISALGIFQGLSYWFGYNYLDGKDCGIYYRNTSKQWQIRRGVILPDEDKESYLDVGAVGGSEWGELLTGLLVYQLAYVILLLLP